MSETVTTMHRCALCRGRGYTVSAKRNGNRRTRECNRCRGTGQHGDRAKLTAPLAVTELALRAARDATRRF